MTYRERMEAAQATSRAAGLRGTPATVFRDLASHGIECWPSLKRLAEMAGVSTRTVRRVLRQLEAAGLVQTIQVEGSKSRYLLKLLQCAPVDKVTQDTAVRGTPDIPDRVPRTLVSGGGGHACPGHPNIELNNETERAGASGASNEDEETVGRIESACGLACSRGEGRRRSARRLRVLIDQHGPRLVMTAVAALPARMATTWAGCTTIGGALVLLERHLAELQRVADAAAARQKQSQAAVAAINEQRQRMAGDRENLAAARAKWLRMDPAERQRRKRAIVAGRPFLRDSDEPRGLVETAAIAALADEATATDDAATGAATSIDLVHQGATVTA